MTQAARTACLFIIRQYTKKLYVVTNGYTIGIYYIFLIKKLAARRYV